MAWARGTADDYIDFLRKVRDFASGAIDPTSDPDFTAGSGPVPSGEQWTVLTNGALQPDLPVSGMATDGELYLMGPGSDPDDEIIVGFRTYRNVGANVFGWEGRGYTAFSSFLDWDTMPGVSPSTLAAFDDTTFDIWIWVNGRRIMCAARIGTTDILLHMGFIQQFGTRNQYPYPLLVTGSCNSFTHTFQTNNFGHSCFPDPCQSGGRLRWVDGTWQTYRNYDSTNPSRDFARVSTGNCVWPQRNPVSSADGVLNSQISEDTIFEQFATGADTYISSSEIDSHVIFPTVLSNGSALIGRVEGLFVLFGLGVVKGDTLTDNSESPPRVYDVFGNTWRSEPVDFFAVLRE